jgi:hypothetical protein
VRRHGIRHALQVAAITILALACMFYPFMPGTHDRLAVTLSIMAQVLGLTGLLMVPIGILWLTDELAIQRARRNGSLPRTARRRWWAFAAMTFSAVVAAGVALAAAIHTGPSLAVFVVTAWAFIIRRALRGVTRRRIADDGRLYPVPVYLIVVPCLLALARLACLPSAVEFSRSRAMEGGAPFIAAVEAYRAAHGRYPASLASVYHDYDPPVVGVERYYYEPQGRAYNVFFEQPTFPIGTREFVMYNPAGEHAMIVHNQDLLESPAKQVEQERRFHAGAAREAGPPHWKYFWFD